MRISVIMPCHNCGPWVGEALQSIAAQTYPAHEIIVINDNSTDDSVEKIESSGVPVKLIHTAYGNAAAARNEGIRHATGDWIAFLDADDIWYPNHLGLFQEQCQNSQARLWFSLWDEFRDGHVIPLIRADKPYMSTESDLGREDTIRSLTAQDGRGYAMLAMIAEKSAIESIGGFDESQVRRHDVELFLRLASDFTWRYSGTPTFRYNITRPNNISSQVAECEYFEMRALVMNRSRYTDPRYDALIRRRTCVALGKLLIGEDTVNVKKVFELGRPYLRSWQAAIYGVAIHSRAFRDAAFKWRYAIRGNGDA